MDTKPSESQFHYLSAFEPTHPLLQVMSESESSWRIECRRVCENCLGEGSVLHDDAMATLELNPRAIAPITGCFLITYAHNYTGCVCYMTEDNHDSPVHEIHFASLRALEEILLTLFRAPGTTTTKRQRSETYTQEDPSDYPRNMRLH